MEKLSRTQRLETLRKTLEEVKEEETKAIQAEQLSQQNVEIPSEDVVFSNQADDFFNQVLADAKKYSIEQGDRSAEDTFVNVINIMVDQEVVPPLSETPKAEVESSEDYEQHVHQEFKNAFQRDTTIEDQLSELEGNADVETSVEDVVEDTTEEIIENEVVADTVETEVVDTVEEGTINTETEESVEVEEVQQEETPIDETIEEVVETEPVINEETVVEEVEATNDTAIEETIVMDTASLIDDELDKALQQRILEETQQLQLRINKYEDELEGITGTVSYTNRILSVIFVVLIFVMLLALGVVLYWIIKVKGII